ncbi:MAG: hypothetical protein MUE44_00830 [Oscillatoriaceae cyanobacterium Prado104]|nr:hypothetical protein [Oscillatoriaceae cyanobacterium Prado104]
MSHGERRRKKEEGRRKKEEIRSCRKSVDYSEGPTGVENPCLIAKVL